MKLVEYYSLFSRSSLYNFAPMYNESNIVGETNVLDIAISPRFSHQVGDRSSQIAIAIVELFRLQGNITGF